MKGKITGKPIVVAALLILAITLLFTACKGKKPDEHTGLFVYATDENGETILDENGVPKTEEWITGIVYATDENGETYTNANGEAVTVKQTRPTITRVIEQSAFVYDEDGNKVTDENGEYVMEPLTVTAVRNVTDANGNNVTQNVTNKNGENVTGTDGKNITEEVTEVYTETVTKVVEVGYEDVNTKYANTTGKKPSTTSPMDNPDYTNKATTDAHTAATLPQSGKVTASCDWLKGAGGAKNDKYVQVQAVGSNAFVALANTESTDGTFADLGKTGFYSILVKYDTSGKILWRCPLGSKGHTRIYDFAVLNDGSFICVGETASNDLGFTNDGSYKSMFCKVSASGTVQWYKTMGGSKPDYFTCVASTPDGGFVAGGKFSSPDGAIASLKLTSLDAVIIKYNSAGNLVWAKRFGGSGSDNTSSIAADSSGNIYAACEGNSTDGGFKGNHGGLDVAIVKFGSDGTQLWSKLLGGSKTEEVNDIYAGASGCIFAGRYASSDGDFAVNRGGYDAYIAFCSADNGSIVWLRTFGGINNDTFNSITSTSFGYAAVGMSLSSNRDLADIGNKGGYDSFIMSIDTKGTVLHVKGLAGSGNDTCFAICKLDSKTFALVGETYKNDGDFASITPAASAKNSTAFVGKFKIF